MINVVHLGFFLPAHALVHVKYSLVAQTRLHFATVCSANKPLSREASMKGKSSQLQPFLS